MADNIEVLPGLVARITFNEYPRWWMGLKDATRKALKADSSRMGDAAFRAGVEAALAALSAQAEAKACPCGLATCKEPWEPGCGLGNSEEHAVVVPEAQAGGDWPDYLMLRDTKLHDDMGGGGQRIFTTAGAGYKKVKYVRADLATPPAKVPEVPWQAQFADALDCFWNAAVGAEREGAQPASACAQGFAAVANRLRELAAAPEPNKENEQ